MQSLLIRSWLFPVAFSLGLALDVIEDYVVPIGQEVYNMLLDNIPDAT